MSEDDVIDVSFHAPTSYSMLLSGLVASGRRLEVRTFAEAYGDVARGTLDTVERCGPPVLRNGASKLLSLAHACGSHVEEASESGVHHHVLVGHCDVTRGFGREHDVAAFRAALRRLAWPAYLRRLREATAALGVVWGRPKPGAAYEIVDPPLHELFDTTPRPHDCYCPRYGSEVIRLPDAELGARERATVHAVEAEVARAGFSYWLPPDPQ